MMMPLKSTACLARTVTRRSEVAAQVVVDHLWFCGGIHQSHRPHCRRQFSSLPPSSLITTTVSFPNKRLLSTNHVPLASQSEEPPPIPDYLRNEYWWAYGNPYCIHALDHQFLVNLVLLGKYKFLRDKCLEELCDSNDSFHIKGKTLQVACVYADFSTSLVNHLAPNSNNATLDIVDVIPAQLTNLNTKLLTACDNNNNNVSLVCNDAQYLQYSSNKFDQVVLFFLLHEMPTIVRRRTLAQALRVLRENGKLVIMDYHKPSSQFRKRVMESMFWIYEPFAQDLWETDIQEWLPSDAESRWSVLSKETYCNSMYQKVVITKTHKVAMQE